MPNIHMTSVTFKAGTSAFRTQTEFNIIFDSTKIFIENTFICLLSSE